MTAAISGPRPGLTFALLLAAAAVMLGGGVWLAQRESERRIPADRTLLRESGAALQSELARLESLYLAHLRRLAGMHSFAIDELPAEAAKVEGVAFVSLLRRDGKTPSAHRIRALAPAPPEPALIQGGRRAGSPFVLGIPREPIFGLSDDAPLPETVEGWAGRSTDAWQAWWQRVDSQQAVVIVVRPAEVRAAMERRLMEMLPAVWSPVRAAGGRDRLESHDGKLLTGPAARPDTAPDLVLPLGSRLGDWQIVSWDRRVAFTAWHLPTLVLAGILSTGTALLGWMVAAAQRRAQREVTARVSFVNRVSHELGAPLTNLRLYMELARDAMPPDAATSSSRLSVAQEETERLIRLVQNVLTFARSERGRLELNPAPCQPAALVQRVLQQFAPALARRGIAVESALEEGDAVLDDDAFAQITANLVSNVEKYAASGTWMRVELDSTAGALRLRVLDRGPGIPAAESERVFLPFERLDSRLTEGVSGTGLGLAIARDLAARMGGSVTLSPRGGGGCVFEVTLPRCGGH